MRRGRGPHRAGAAPAGARRGRRPGVERCRQGSPAEACVTSRRRVNRRSSTMLAGRSRRGSPMRRTMRVVPTSGARWAWRGASDPIGGDGGTTAADADADRRASATATGSGGSDSGGTAGAACSRAGTVAPRRSAIRSDAVGIWCAPATEQPVAPAVVSRRAAGRHGRWCGRAVRRDQLDRRRGLDRWWHEAFGRGDGLTLGAAQRHRRRGGDRLGRCRGVDQRPCFGALAVHRDAGLQQPDHGSRGTVDGANVAQLVAGDAGVVLRRHRVGEPLDRRRELDRRGARAERGQVAPRVARQRSVRRPTARRVTFRADADRRRSRARPSADARRATTPPPVSPRP